MLTSPISFKHSIDRNNVFMYLCTYSVLMAFTGALLKSALLYFVGGKRERDMAICQFSGSSMLISMAVCVPVYHNVYDTKGVA